MTYRERRAARADRLRGWADKRTTNATAALNSYPEIRHDYAFNTQPGHIPFRARMIAADDRAHESLQKAASMNSRADGIDAAAERAIYSDDPDAIERLTARIAELETKREQRKTANLEYRKAHRAELAAMPPYERGQAVPYPSYSLTNLSGDISRQRARLHALQHPAPTTFHASRRDPDTCYKCDYRQADHTPHATVPSILLCPTAQAPR